MEGEEGKKAGLVSLPAHHCTIVCCHNWPHKLVPYYGGTNGSGGSENRQTDTVLSKRKGSWTLCLTNGKGGSLTKYVFSAIVDLAAVVVVDSVAPVPAQICGRLQVAGTALFNVLACTHHETLAASGQGPVDRKFIKNLGLVF